MWASRCMCCMHLQVSILCMPVAMTNGQYKTFFATTLKSNAHKHMCLLVEAIQMQQMLRWWARWPTTKYCNCEAVWFQWRGSWLGVSCKSGGDELSKQLSLRSMRPLLQNQKPLEKWSFKAKSIDPIESVLWAKVCMTDFIVAILRILYIVVHYSSWEEFLCTGFGKNGFPNVRVFMMPPLQVDSSKLKMI